MYFCDPWIDDEIIFNKDIIESRGFDSVERNIEKQAGYIFKKSGQPDRVWNAKKLLLMGYAKKSKKNNGDKIEKQIEYPKFSYSVDIVMCIDLTGSMAPVIEKVKDNVLSFGGEIVEAMEEARMDVCQLRIRVIGFRDFGSSQEPIVDSERFFMLPDDNREFENFVRNLQVDSESDKQASGLEAIALALKSDWTYTDDKLRQWILVFTDSTAHPLGFGSNSVHYPEGMPTDLATLGSWWEGTDWSAVGPYNFGYGRMVVFAPEVYPWNEMEAWNRYWLVPSKAGADLEDVDYQYAFDVIVSGDFD